MKHLLFR